MKKRITIFDKYKAGGLVDGKIKPLEACNFLEVCKSRADNCPTENKYDHTFSCALCRGLTIVYYDKQVLGSEAK